MKKIPLYLLLAGILCFALYSCGNADNYVPKPAAYLRFTFPEKHYVACDTAALPFTFEYAEGAEIVWKKNTRHEKWIDIAYPQYDGVVFLTYKHLDSPNDLKAQIDTSYQLLKLHFDYAAGMVENQFFAPNRNVTATTCNLKGKNVASTLQFWATDSLHHFLRGSLYLKRTPNNDSLAPLIEYLQQDVLHLIESLEWRSPLAATITPVLGTLVQPIDTTPTEKEITLMRHCIDGQSVTLAATLTLPPLHKNTKCPAVLLVSGSGQQDRDETIFGHKPFRTIARYFASHGIATLRYDDRGVGGSSGALDSATTYDFADDAEALFHELLHHPQIDPRKVGILGHSEGGAIAPLIAARNRNVGFVVMLAGQGCSGQEVLLQQNEAIFRLMGIDDSLIALRLLSMREFFDALHKFEPQQLDSAFKAIVNHNTGHLTKKQRRSIGMLGGDAYLFAQQLQIPWWRTFLDLDPANYLPNVDCPILALNGEKDCQVIAEPNIANIKRLCTANLTATTFADMNHLFQHCSTGATDEYATIAEDIAPEVLQCISQWITALP